MKRAEILVLVLTIILVTACAEQVVISSNKAPGYMVKPKRIFVLTNIGSEYGKKFFNSFHKEMTSIANDCAVTMYVSKVSPLELDMRHHANKIKHFKPDAGLIISYRGGTLDYFGNVVMAKYDVMLSDLGYKRNVWRASIEFSVGEFAGDVLAVEITNKMKEDGILHSCTMIKTKNNS